ncbi:Beta/gamma crystallin [Trinorchestia longiramus]|nr:Beta/gamma crystallin [Trinorchestia longiramus]
MAGFEPAVFLHEAETRYRTRAADHSTTVAEAEKVFREVVMLQAGSPSSVLQLEVEARRGVPMSVVEEWLMLSVQRSSCWTYVGKSQMLRYVRTYTNYNQMGSYMDFYYYVPNLSVNGFDNAIYSITVNGRWGFYTDTNYHGTCCDHVGLGRDANISSNCAGKDLSSEAPIVQLSLETSTWQCHLSPSLAHQSGLCTLALTTPA